MLARFANDNHVTFNTRKTIMYTIWQDSKPPLMCYFHILDGYSKMDNINGLRKCSQFIGQLNT